MSMLFEDAVLQRASDFIEEVERDLCSHYAEIDATAAQNFHKVLTAMQKTRMSEAHLGSTNGYGYSDIGRDGVEEVYAALFRTEDALVRPQIVSGTHALTLALFGNLRHGDEVLSPVGAPYDTMLGVLGVRETAGSLAEHGVSYRQVDLLPDESFDWDGIRNAITDKTKLVLIQRSKGYQSRRSLSPEDIGALITFVKAIRSDVICMVDNCYGEFCVAQEPSEFGADMCVGSLIKNIGGGLAPVGGYIVGTKQCVERAAVRLTAPGLGKEVGPGLGVPATMLHGLFLAPSVVAAAMKGSLLFSAVFEKLGYAVTPHTVYPRHDIVTAVTLGAPEKVIAFCKGIQKAAPIDSYVVPEPWAMPGYDCEVIMAAGAFVQGSSIELSADAPMKPPYTVYVQGGVCWPHGKIGAIYALAELYRLEGALPG